MSTMVNGHSAAAIGNGIVPARTDSDSSAGGTAGRTRQAAATLEQYMQRNGIDTVTPNQLSQLARNTAGDTPAQVSGAASFLLRNPDIYALLETHDVPGCDGISGASNLGFAARGGYDARLQDAPPSAATPPAPGVTEQEARSAIAAFRQQNPAARIDANTLYQLAVRPNGDTAPATSAAARFLLRNPDALDRITAQPPEGSSDASGSQGASQEAALPGEDRVAAVQPRSGQASGGGGGGAEAMDAQKASRILADQMLSTPSAGPAMTVDRLYRLAEGGEAPPEVAAAAKFMLRNPDIYRAIETHDVPGADGRSAVGNLQAAARGEIPGVGGKASSATKDILQLLRLLVQALRGTSGSAGAAGASKAPSTASAETPAAAASATTPTAAQPLDARSASRILADHMVSEAGGAEPPPMTADRLYQLAQGQGPVAEAARFMLQHPDTYRAIETHDVAGADGISGVGNLQAAARGEIPGVGGAAPSSANSVNGSSNLLQQLKVLQQLLQIVSQLFKGTESSPAKQPLDGQSASRVLADHMMSEAGGARRLLGGSAPTTIAPLTPDRLYQLAQGQGPVAEAAKFMLQNPDVYRAIETHDVAGADGISGVGNLLAAARGEVPGVTGKAGQAPQQLQQLLQVLRALLPLVQAAAGTQAAQRSQGQDTTPSRSAGNRSVPDVLQQLLQVLKGAQNSQSASRAQPAAEPLDGQHAASILSDYMMQTRRLALTRDPMSSVRELLGQAAEGMQIFEQQNRMMQIGLQMRLLQLSTTVA